jgi:CHASE3 domain sensor protein
MVPVEPTMEMLDEFDSIIDYGAEDSKEAWSRLIAAAPQGDEVMADTFRAMIPARRGCERKTVTTEVELVSYVKERSTGNSEARYT